MLAYSRLKMMLQHLKSYPQNTQNITSLFGAAGMLFPDTRLIFFVSN